MSENFDSFECMISFIKITKTWEINIINDIITYWFHLFLNNLDSFFSFFYISSFAFN